MTARRATEKFNTSNLGRNIIVTERETLANKWVYLHLNAKIIAISARVNWVFWQWLYDDRAQQSSLVCFTVRIKEFEIKIQREGKRHSEKKEKATTLSAEKSHRANASAQVLGLTTDRTDGWTFSTDIDNRWVRFGHNRATKRARPAHDGGR